MVLRTLSALVVACLSLSPATAPRAQDQVKIGLVAPFTGPAAIFGQELSEGVQAAIKDINAAGGINGRKIEVIVRDDGCMADKAQHQLSELAEKEKVVAAVGLPCPASAIVAREIARTMKMLVLAMASTPELTRGDAREVLRPIGRADRLAEMAADVLRNQFAGKKVAWLGAETSQFSLFFRAAAERRKIDLTAIVTNAAPNAEMMQALSGYDVVLISRFVPPEWVRDFVGKAAGSTVILVLDTLRPRDIEPLQGASKVILLSNPEPGFAPGAARESGPGGYFPYGYAAIEILKGLAAVAKDFSAEKLATMAREVEVPTVLGKLRFDATGDVRGWLFQQWQRTGPAPAAYAVVDVCRAPNCKDYSQCPPQCPRP
jgi:branched-chain amino acid transport system substrate-binding protein